MSGLSGLAKYLPMVRGEERGGYSVQHQGQAGPTATTWGEGGERECGHLDVDVLGDGGEGYLEAADGGGVPWPDLGKPASTAR